MVDGCSRWGMFRLIFLPLAAPGLVVALATDKTDYGLGETIHFCLVLENTGTDTLRWGSGAAPMHGFCVLPDTCATLTQAGCQGAALFWYPSMLTWFGDSIVVPPGECAVRYATWDGWVVVDDDIGPYYYHLELPAAGGWHDAGDFRKWLSLTQGNVTALAAVCARISTPSLNAVAAKNLFRNLPSRARRSKKRRRSS